MKFRYAGAAICVVLGASAFGAPALAQAVGQDAATMAQNAEALPPGTKQVEVDPGVEVWYDSNVARSDAQVAALRGIRPQDELFDASALMNLVLPVGRESVFLVGTAGYDFYSHNPILNREHIDVVGGADGRLGPCQGAVTGGYARYQSDLDELNVISPTQPQLGVKNVVNHESVGANAICGRPVGLAPTVTVREDWNTNSASLLQTSNYRSFTATGGVAYRRPIFGSVTLFGDYVKADFPEQFLFGLFPIPEGYQLYGGGARYDKTVGARILGELSISYTSLEPISPLSPAFQGVTYIADLKYSATNRLKVHFNFHRAVNPSNRFGASYYIEREELLEATYDASSRLSLTAGISEANRRFEGPNLNPVLDISDEDDWDFYGSLNFAMTRRLTLGLDVRQEERRANLTEYGYSDTRVGLSLKAHF